ncbi:DNA alkylation repair protein [Romboutsia sp. 1001216sp1]|uniref:DNA alkylation repair protein n=1 Tax=unclassified Romboutsia TaxID=2626894 RepID=UPI0018AB488F|nr:MULTISPECIES: DNA alkylation repair protein [unclassified Romboutsia]MDB8793088.1 DNA alkylation repair protein [Romboutsia sp. 1001216sp1]MDB8795881.1 DNA alkylation repair protein [Romboutsia sp. 1001216sp1]MDB8799376.1 DNA alkylation repair protein [Romboutsia sp. 1001216sp1]
MNEKIREELLKLSEEKYREFSSRLIPGIDNILGVRLLYLRKIAKSIAKKDWREYLKSANNTYFEEVMLQGMVIGYVKDSNIEEILVYIKNFIPKINNWSVCDSFCSGLKITNKNKEIVWEFLKKYLSSEKEYEVRFAVVMILNYYIDEEYIRKVLKELDKVNHDGYYVKMAVAWAVSMCYVKFEDITLEYLNNNNLDDFTYNKSLQKICESLKIDKERKVLIKSMKR